MATEQNMNILENEFKKRHDDIKNDLLELFEQNLRITDWDIPEPDDRSAAKIILDIFEEKINELKQDIQNGKYDNF